MDTNQYTISDSATLRQAIERLNSLSGGAMVLFIIDPAGKVVGSLTDGDVRRALLRGVELDSPVTDAANARFRSVSAVTPDVGRIRRWREEGLRLLPVLDAEGALHSVLDLKRTANALPMSAVLMAGGKGERLRPLTLDTPKPLLQIEGKAIIDYNIEALAAVGVNDITVTTRYLADKLDEHFARPVASVQVKTVREDAPLGTIGAVSLIDLPDSGVTLVMNSDLITTISFEDMYLHHLERGAAVTIAAIPYQVSVPFAIMRLDGQRVMGLDEKPSYSYYANAGIYIFDNRLLHAVPRNTPVDAPDLITDAIAAGEVVSYFPINGSWIDVGTPTDFRQAAELMRHHKNFSSRRAL